MNSLFRDTNTRFGEAARELRDVAEDVQKALDMTRQELKRGIFELPNETRESAQAMRRVVADQIKALSELNDIVSRQSRQIEYTEPARAPAREEPVEPRRVREQAREQRAPREEREPAPVNGNGHRRPQRIEREREPEPVRGGWFNELIGRQREGQREAEPRQERLAPPSSEAFDTLSIDITRMIDHDASVEVWDRYKRGERNVFTRKLYTMQGQKAFEEIRRRYRRSGEFRETVDRYIDEFEHLLDQVARDDRGQVLTKTYLTSDTGKVYTLLAHAAGRLD